MESTCEICRGKGCDMDWPESKLDELEKLSQKLGYPPVLASAREAYQVLVPEGRCYYWNPQPHGEATCSQFLNTPGRFSVHSHDQREWLIIYHGSMLLTVGDEPERRLGVGDHAVIDPGVSHLARFDEACEYYAITVPATRDWEPGHDPTARDDT